MGVLERHTHKLPATLIPEGDVCVPLYIPNDPDYVAILVHAIRELELDRHYERDAAHSAKIVRDQWSKRTITPLIEALATGTPCAGSFEGTDNNCFSYPTYAPFVQYTPMNPYTNPNEIPFDWLAPPFQIYDGGGSLPPAYQAGDIIVPFSAITLNPFDIFGGNLPTIAITVVGSGQLELDILSIGNGGLCAVSLDGAPSILQILQGQFSQNTIVIDTNLDISLPAEDDISIQHEVDIVAAAGEETTVYLTFMPVIDDQLFSPLRFGGGFRGLQLCGFEDVGVIMGITDIRINGCEIEKFENGVWSPITGSLTQCIDNAILPVQNLAQQNEANIASNLVLINQNSADISAHNVRITQNETDIASLQLDATQQALLIQANTNNIASNDTELFDHETRITALENAGSGGGSGGGVDIKTSTITLYNGGNRNTQSATFVSLAALRVLHQFTHPNALIMVEVTHASSTGNDSFVAVYLDGQFGISQNRVNGAVYRSSEISETFYNIDTTQPIEIGVGQRTGGTGTSRIVGWSTLTYTILEYGSSVASNVDPVVTFDTGGYPYTLATDPQFEGIVSSGGNPDNCVIKQSLTQTQGIQVEIDLGEAKQIQGINLDIFCSTLPDIQVWWWLDGVAKTGIQPVGTNNVWGTHALPAGDFPVTGQVVFLQAFIPSGGNPVAELRLDNISIDTGGV